jgi:hypothetical protein
MKYKDQNTLKMQSKFESRIVGDSDRARKRKREKELNEFWNRSLKGHLSEDFWNTLDISEKESTRIDYIGHLVKRNITYNPTPSEKEEFARRIKLKYPHRLTESREKTLIKLGIL